MTVSLEDILALEALEDKIRAILPALYSDSYEDVLPGSMGSAGLKYDLDGHVAWDQIWGSFCDLAMAGGPPHRGSLLQPGTAEEIEHNRERYDHVSKEIRRGIGMVTRLATLEPANDGWIGVECHGTGMASWLMRAIVMENVLARREDRTLFLPAGPEFRLAKEIKNVITVIAKTCHYWIEHTPPEQQAAIEALFENASLLEPASISEIQCEPQTYREVVEHIAAEIGANLKLPCFTNRYPGWVGIECRNSRTAIWVMRALVAEDVLSRREGEVVFVPAHPNLDAEGGCERLLLTFLRVHRLSVVKKIA
jgi:sirohydrochlorin cobaltochelatase